MNVPNVEKKAFRDLTAEERSAIVEAWISGGIEYFNNQNESWDTKTSSSTLVSTTAYRTRQRQLTIPWEVIKPEYKWVAMDEDSSVWAYESRHKPSVNVEGGYWGADVSASCVVNLKALNIDTTGIDWSESLVERPEGV